MQYLLTQEELDKLKDSRDLINKEVKDKVGERMTSFLKDISREIPKEEYNPTLSKLSLLITKHLKLLND